MLNPQVLFSCNHVEVTAQSTVRMDMHSIVSLLAAQVLLLSPLTGLEHLSTQIDRKLLAASGGIEVISVFGTFSHLEYPGKPGAAPLKPQFPVYTFRPLPTLFGRCNQANGRLIRQGDVRCGYQVPLSNSGRTINLLGYDEVSLSGHFSGTWEVAFSDGQAGGTGYAVALGRISVPGGGKFALGPVFRVTDASRGGHLILRLVSESGSATVDEVSFRHTVHRPGGTGRGIWILNRNRVLGQEEQTLDKLSEHSITRVYLQVGDDPAILGDFLRKAARRGIEVYALDGSPNSVAAPEALLARIKAVETYNRTHPEACFAGFQTDIEPYLNKDFNSRKGYYATAYADLLAVIKKGFNVPLSVVVPFWFDTIHEGGKSLIQRIVETADEVVVKSTRTDSATALDMARATLSLGEQFNKPVLLGIELGPIPDEHHVEFETCAPHDPGAVKIAEQWLRRRAEYDVYGSVISFNSRMSDLPAFMKTDVPFASFNGWVLRSFEELP
jgi:hypothetical protein